MKEETQGVPLAVVLEIDWASPEATIESFNKVDDNLTAQLTNLSEELCEAQLAADKSKTAAEVEVRNAAVSSGNKITEGYVAVLIAKNVDVEGTAAKAQRLACKVAGVKAAIASLERKHSLFKYWLAGQRKIGLDER